MISSGTAKLNTDRNAKDLGATKGNRYDSNSIAATSEFKKKMILLIPFNFFIRFIFCQL